MKTGFILECGPKGADAQVIPYLAQKILPSLTIGSVITLDRKDKMLPICGTAARGLLDEGCDLVLVLWDVMPRWEEVVKPYCYNDVIKARRSLVGAGVDCPEVRFVCFENELESWIAADKRAISSALSRPEHKVNFPRIKNPHLRKNIKGDLSNAFYNLKNYGYIDLDHAFRIVKNLPDLSQLRQVPSFVRFESLILATAAPCSRHLSPIPPLP